MNKLKQHAKTALKAFLETLYIVSGAALIGAGFGYGLALGISLYKFLGA